jgi:diguanylate cyclase (GGDEF)-like protein
MEKKKRIAVMAGIISSVFDQDTFKGIISEAFALGYDVATFSLFTRNGEETPYQAGEENIFKLINFDEFDGLLFIEYSINNPGMTERIEKFLMENCTIPYVEITNEYKFSLMDFDDNRHAQEVIVDHLIDKHGLKKIYYLTGLRGNEIAELRLKGYRDSMKKHGLEVKPGYVIDGDFYINKAYELAENIIAGKVERPQAVVCGNDSMALALCEKLQDAGIIVPNNMVITGFDALAQALDNVPSLTTYSMSDYNLGMLCMSKFHEQLSGETLRPAYGGYVGMLIGRSCGCDLSNHLDIYRKSANVKWKEILDREGFERANIDENLTDTENTESCIEKLKESAYLLGGFSRYYLCLFTDWKNINNNREDTAVSEKVSIVLAKNGSCDIENGCTEFNSDKMLPYLLEKHDRPQAFYFTPVHFGAESFGYNVIIYDEVKTFNTNYAQWNKFINSALQNVRQKEHMRHLNEQIYQSSIRDTLTGIYNRNGFTGFSLECFKSAKESESKKLLIIAIDMDGLKKINDTYGHVEGDSALIIMANAISSACTSHEYPARVGGDEFYIIGTDEYTPDDIEHKKNKIKRYLDEYNSTSEKIMKLKTVPAYYALNLTECIR